MPGEAVTTARQVLDRLLDERLHRQLLTIALAIVRDPTVAEEVVQDVYAAVLDEGSTLADVSDAEVYLRACVRNETRRRAGELHRRSTRTAEIDEGRVACTRPSAREYYLVEREIPASLPQDLRLVYELWCGGMERHEALPNRAVMKGHRHRLVTASRLKLRAARPWERRRGRQAALTKPGRVRTAR